MCWQFNFQQYFDHQNGVATWHCVSPELSTLPSCCSSSGWDVLFPTSYADGEHSLQSSLTSWSSMPVFQSAFKMTFSQSIQPGSDIKIQSSSPDDVNCSALILVLFCHQCDISAAEHWNILPATMYWYFKFDLHFANVFLLRILPSLLSNPAPLLRGCKCSIQWLHVKVYARKLAPMFTLNLHSMHSTILRWGWLLIYIQSSYSIYGKYNPAVNFPVVQVQGSRLSTVYF